MSAHVNRAIQAAIELEALDTHPPPRVPSKDSMYRPRAPAPPSDSTSTLSHKSTGTTASVSSSKTSTAPALPPKDASPSKQTKQPSKLALLAQAKASQSKSVKNNANTKAVALKPSPKTVDPDIGVIPEPGQQYTRYLEPIANGDTVTTAITYSYESLRTLTNPSRPNVGTPHVVSLDEATAGGGKKPSKLAAKARKQKEESQLKALPLTEENIALVPDAPAIFLPTKTMSRATPSAFATVLVEDPVALKQKRREEKHQHRRQKSKDSEATTVHIVSAVVGGNGDGNDRRVKKSFVPDFSTPSAFDFKEPSRDDVVLRAREGTTLSGRHKDKAPQSPTSPTFSRTSVKA